VVDELLPEGIALPDAERMHSSHWGSFLARSEGGQIRVRPNTRDPEPSQLLRNIPDALRHRSRVARPAIRRGWLTSGPGADDRRGDDSYVEVSWDEALGRLADELGRVRSEHGNGAIFGGSYGWSSAGRFHHAQSQIHRFLNCIGGYVSSVNTYSSGASEVLLPHVMGSFWNGRSGLDWDEIERATELVVAFGGMAPKNSEVGAGGVGRHIAQQALRGARRRGAEFLLVSPLRDDLAAEIGHEWLAAVPGTDTALMLALAFVLLDEDLLDRDFLDRCCVGFDIFELYLRGQPDGIPKSPAWAAPITGVAASEIGRLARRMAAKRTLITVSLSLQRAEYGEQPVWMGMVLAAMLGAIGREGSGYLHGLGALANVGKPLPVTSTPALPQGENRVREFIPVARIADMLLHPGAAFDYNGRRLAYPDIRLVYWAGGNPFHHHQDLGRLRRAFARPDTIVVHEQYWTATACHADIVLPATLTLERNDIGGVSDDAVVTAMHRIVDPATDARDDYAILGDLSVRMGVADAFTEGRSADQWVRWLYEGLRTRLAEKGHPSPDFESFWEQGELILPTIDDGARIRRFREDPANHPLATPSGRLEIFSETIASFAYADCPGHPVWLPPIEGAGSAGADRFPLQLVANQPRGRLHSQLDFGARSLETKAEGRERLRITPADAARRGIADGDVVRVFNDRGAFLAAADVSDQLRGGVVQCPTGAWYDPVDGLCVAGNPNSVTRDAGTSRLAQASTGQLCLVEVERFTGAIPAGRGHAAPRFTGVPS
jgi:biotin/methionine sulfoxide reductase